MGTPPGRGLPFSAPDEETQTTRTVLGGSVFEHDLGDQPIKIQASDVLRIEGTPLRVRQLIFKDGVFPRMASWRKIARS